MTMSRHVVVSKLSQSFVVWGLRFCQFFICVLSSSSTDASFCKFLQVPFTSIAKISTTCCPLFAVACEMHVAATSEVLLPNCSNDMALFAALHTVSRSAFETRNPRVATRCSFLNTDCNARRNWMNACFCLGGLLRFSGATSASLSDDADVLQRFCHSHHWICRRRH